MARFISCINNDHNIWMVLFAALICAASCATIAALAAKIKITEGKARTALLLFGGVVIGFGVWATHFVAMIGYQFAGPVGYDIPLTVLSGIMVIVSSTVAIWCATPQQGRLVQLSSGVVFALGVISMHYTGMAALRIPYSLELDPVYVMASIICALLFSVLSFHYIFVAVNLKQRIAGVIFMIVAICGLHFLAMTAATFVTDLLPSGQYVVLQPIWLAAGIGMSAALLLGFGLLQAIGPEPKELWKKFGVALAMTGVLAMTSFAVEFLSLSNTASLSKNINETGRLRFEAQRIVALAAELSAYEKKPDIKASEDALTSAIADYKTKSGRLLFEHISLIKFGNVEFDDHTGVRDQKNEDEITVFLGLAKQISRAAPENRQALYLALKTELNERLIPFLDNRITALVDVSSSFAVKNGVKTFAFLATLLVLVVEAVLIFWPAHHTIVSSINLLEKQKEAAEFTATQKSQFLANMSHEIRTPLNGVLGMAQILAKTDLDEDQRECTDIILASGKSLRGIINDILDLSKIEAGLLELDPEPADLVQIVRATCDTVRGIALEKDIAIDMRTNSPLDKKYVCDAPRIQQILVNLAGNAVKFTEQGEVVIEIISHPNNEFEFSVRDTGPGISPEDQQRIFERFGQVDQSSTRQHGGTGLGLAISQDLVSLMGGSMGVESELGAGSRFWFRVCLEPGAKLEPEKAEPDNIQPAGPEPRSVVAPSRTIRVLLVEDNATNQQVVSTALSNQDMRLCIADNGQEALDTLAAAPFDIILMDIHMPVMNGEEAIRRIRASNAPYKNIPIIVLSASVVDLSENAASDMGADAFLPKPFNIEDLVSTIHELANVSKKPTLTVVEQSA